MFILIDAQHADMASLVNPILESLPKVEQLSSRVWRVLGLNPGLFTLQGTNTYLVGNGENRILIDTGEANKPEYVSLLKETLEELKARVSQIIITHWHHDHIGGLDGVCSLYPNSNLPVYKLPLPPSSTPLPDSTKDPHANVSKRHLFANRVTYLSDGDVVETEGATLKVIATPGHTQDHMALVINEENAIFTGDCILGQGSAVFEDLGSYLRSLHRLNSLSPSLLYPGHGPVIRDTAKIQQYIDHRMAREKQVIDHLERVEKPVTPMEIVQEMYKDVDKKLWLGAEGNVKLHLVKLLEEQKVSRIEGEDGEIRWSLTLEHKL